MKNTRFNLVAVFALASQLLLMNACNNYSEIQEKAVPRHKYLTRIDFERQIKECEEAIKINPQDDNAYCLLGRSLNAIEHYHDAIEQFEKGLSINPKNELIYIHWGRALNGLGKELEAIEKFEQAVMVDPQSSNAYGHLSFTLNAIGRVEEAYYHMISYFACSNNKGAAMRYLELTLELNKVHQRYGKDDFIGNSSFEELVEDDHFSELMAEYFS